MKNNCEKGAKGEQAAAMWMEKQGMVIIEKNYRGTYGEIDLIAKEGEYFVFIEVKCRSTIKKGLPREAVGKRKQQKIITTALEYIEKNNLGDLNFRFDVMEMMDNQGKLYYNYIRNAFWAEI